MSQHDHGVTDLLRRASDDLAPDVDRLVSGAITRGRSRQRRARIGTTVASLAVIGVVGGLAAVVPRLVPDAVDGDAVVATDGPSETPSETPSATPPPTPTPTPLPGELPRELADFDATSIPAMVYDVLGTTPATRPVVTQTVVGGDERMVTFLHEGTATDVGVEPKAAPSLAACRAEGERLGGSCEPIPDGGLVLRWGPTLADQVTCQGVAVYRYGNEVWATSCNALESKDSPPTTDEPPLGLDALYRIAVSDTWFR